MTPAWSIRTRLTAWYSIVLAVSLAAFGGTVWLVQRQTLLAELDGRLGESANGFARFLESEASTDDIALVRTEAEEYAASMSAEQTLRIWDYNGHLLLSLPRSMRFAAGPQSGLRTWRSRTGTYRMISRDVTLGGRRYLTELGISLGDVDAILSHLRTVLLTSVPLVLGLASAGGWWLSRRALEPVDRMTREASALGTGDLSARLRVPETGDELASLAEAWNGVLSKLQAAVERQARFTADASHELRTPVALVRTTAELALRHQRSANEYRQALTQIAGESERMSQLIEDLLSLARADSGSGKFSTVNVSEIVQDACRDLAMIAAQKGIGFRCDIPDEPIAVRGDPRALRRLVFLLADNALKYTSSGGTISVAVTERNALTTIEVQDTGVGIAPEDLPHVFERFWRADRARTSGGGAGLGLALARSIVLAHDGQIETESVLHNGSIFRVLLPRTGRAADGTFAEERHALHS